MKNLYFLALLPLLFAACECSNEPESEVGHRASYYVSQIQDLNITFSDPSTGTLYQNNVDSIKIGPPFYIYFDATSGLTSLFVVNTAPYEQDVYLCITIDQVVVKDFNGTLKSNKSVLLQYGIPND